MSPLHVVGVGLGGRASLSATTCAIVDQATLLVGSDRHLSNFQDHPAPHLVLNDLAQILEQLQQHLRGDPRAIIVILVSGDPLFFGLGRLLLTTFAPEQLTFHPHLSSVQIAFNRIKVPWQDAEVISAHGRSLEQLTTALQAGVGKIAVLTDATNSPAAIADLYLGLDLPLDYQFWVCENLEGLTERVQKIPPSALREQTFAPLNLVILLCQDSNPNEALAVGKLPVLGLPDRSFRSFRDRPGLITKREVRVLAIAELALQPGQVVWDIGAGTGSVAIEMARLVPETTIYAIEKTAIGVKLIRENSRRLQVNNIHVIHGTAPSALMELPQPYRIFIGGSGGHLREILDYCQRQLKTDGLMVLALATLEHLQLALAWFKEHHWSTQILQIQISRSTPIASLTRLIPLNPVILIRANRP